MTAPADRRRPRTLFFGTPAFSVPCLDVLAAHTDVVGVVSQPDRARGRGRRVEPTPVKARALALGLEVLQPVKVRRRELADELAAREPDLGVVIAYGRILPRRLLDVPRLGCVNVHASLLPRWRGAAPIQWAVASGDAETGVCLMQMDEGMDTGPVLARRATPIDPDETSADLFERLSRLGADLLEASLPALLAGALTPEPQDEARATAAPLLTKADGHLRFDRPARAVHDRVRAMVPWPGAEARLDGVRVKVHRTSVPALEAPAGAASGEVLRADSDGLDVACGDRTVLRLEELQLEGRRRMPARELLAGHPIGVGQRFRAPAPPEDTPEPGRETK